jgi:hypothetical protein
MRHIKRLYDFFRLWFKWKDAREAWQDAGTLVTRKLRKYYTSTVTVLVSDPTIKIKITRNDKTIESYE